MFFRNKLYFINARLCYKLMILFNLDGSYTNQNPIKREVGRWLSSQIPDSW